MHTRTLLAPALLGLLLTAVACGEGAAPTTSGKDDGTTDPGTVETPAIVVLDEKHEKQADLLLWVSNQSFIDDPVHLTVMIDGVEVVDDDFEVGSQHTWVSFPLSLPAGEHEIEAVAVLDGEAAATMTETFMTPESGDQRYALVDYWNYDDKDGRHVDWMFQKRPIYFA